MNISGAPYEITRSVGVELVSTRVNNFERNGIMYPTLMNLYMGNLNLAKLNTEDFPLQKYHEEEYDKIKEQLDKLLDDYGRKLLNELLDKHICGKSYSDTEAFINGFRIATMMMVEVYYDKDNLLETKEQYLRHMLHRPFYD